MPVRTVARATELDSVSNRYSVNHFAALQAQEVLALWRKQTHSIKDMHAQLRYFFYLFLFILVCIYADLKKKTD